jgi:hypothetical protein
MNHRTHFFLVTAAMTGIALTATAGAPPDAPLPPGMSPAELETQPTSPPAPHTAAQITSRPDAAPAKASPVIDFEGKALVRLTGSVIDKTSKHVWLEYGMETVKVNIRDDIQWYEIYERDAVDVMNKGEPVTVSGRIKSGSGPMKEIDAHALYVPSANTTFLTDARTHRSNDRWSSAGYENVETNMASANPPIGPVALVK